MMRYRHVSLMLTRKCTQSCEIALAVPDEWDEARVRAAVEARDMLDSILYGLHECPKWNLDDEPGEPRLECVESDAAAPTVAIGIDGEDDEIVSPYTPSWQDPPPDAWIDVDGTRWATDGKVLVREGASMHPRGWCQWRRMADALPSPKAVAEVLANAQREAVPLTGGITVEAHDYRLACLRFDGPGFRVDLDVRYSPGVLAGLRIAGRGSLNAVCFYEAGDALAYIAMPVRLEDR